MAGFRAYMGAGGWRVTNGDREHGPYPTYQQALQSAENLNLQHRAQEERSFAPLEPTVTGGDRREAHLTREGGVEEKVMHGARPTGPLPPQMVSETGGATPDQPIGDVRVYPDEPTVWEAVEEAPEAAPPDGERAAREAVERARVGGTDSPAAGPASMGGGVV